MSAFDHGIHLIAHADGLFWANRPDAPARPDRVVASLHFGDHGVVIVAVKPSPIAYLPAGFGVEGRVIEDDFAFFAGFEFCAPWPF